MKNHKTTIKINGNKLRSLLETATGKTIYQIATESGYSKNVIANAVHNGYASSAVQNIARLYGITPDMYKAKDPEPIKEPDQISIDDIESIKRSELLELIKDREDLKELIKETILETLESFRCYNIRGAYDPINRIYTVDFKIDKEAYL